MTRRWPDFAAVATIVVAHLVLYRKVVRLFWTYDDPNILRTIFMFGFTEPFTNAAVWPQQLFTPLMVVAFDAQFAAFAFDTPRWYAAHLGLAILATLLTYAVTRHFFNVATSLSAAITFAAGVPLCSVVTQLSTVHYFIAIIFGALATLAWIRSWPLVSALAYLLAMLAKEIACPLPLLFFAMPLRDVRTRIRQLIPHAIGAIVYLAWRYKVLGTIGGAYGWVIEANEWPRLIALLPWRVAQAAAGVNLAIGLTLVALMLIAILLQARTKVTLAALIIVALPLLPLAKEVNRRYVAAPWLAYSIAFAAAASSFRNKRVASALLLAAPVVTIIANRQEWRAEFGLRQRMSAEARVFTELPPSGVLRNPRIPPAQLAELNMLRIDYLHKPPGTSWFYDDIYLCGDPNILAGKQVYEYDPAQRMLVDITARMPEIAQKHCANIRHDAPLRVEFRFRDPALHWSVGPYAEGKYSAVIANGFQAFEIPRRDALNLPGSTGFPIRVRYDSPEGWTTYSPELVLDFKKQPDVVWQRGGSRTGDSRTFLRDTAAGT